MQGATFGFEGKQCIHPSQVPVVNRLFSPAADRVAWARGVLQADREGREQGRGAFALGAAMIDAPTVMLARQVVERAERASSGAGEEMRGSPPDVNPLSEDIF